MTREEVLHGYAREFAANLIFAGKALKPKLIRWNDIVCCALDFYPENQRAGVRECLQSCVEGDVMFDGKNTLAASLIANYGWMK